MRRWLWVGITALLAGVIALAFIRPHAMVSPGNLIAAHTSLQDDCFACHVPFRGASADRCIGCHVVAQIGLRTTKGVAIKRSGNRPAFHQALVTSNCLACHNDHPQPRLAPRTAALFDHAQLRPELRPRCEQCHVPPRDEQHRGQNLPCAQCHQTKAWTPATFDHDRYFRLDQDHRTACITCHVGSNYRRFTCYGCHEHQPDRIRAKHLEEGIRDIENCVRCHRSAEGEAGEGREGDE
jgi:hypothetical protein